MLENMQMLSQNYKIQQIKEEDLKIKLKKLKEETMKQLQ